MTSNIHRAMAGILLAGSAMLLPSTITAAEELSYRLQDFLIKGRVQNSPTNANSRISDVRLCERAIELYNQRPGPTPLLNSYAGAEDDLRSWSFENRDPNLYFQLNALNIRLIETTLVEEVGGRTVQTISLRCPLPLDWQLDLWEDADVLFPQALTKFSQRDPGRNGLLIDGSVGGIGFSLLPAVGYEPSFTWVLNTKTHDLGQVKEHIATSFPFVSWSKTRINRHSLIPSDVPDPLQIMALTNSAVGYGVSRLWVKGPGFPEGEMLMPVYSAWSSAFDFSLSRPLQAMARNSQPALLALTSLKYPDYTVEPCTQGSAITDPSNCLNVNRSHFFQQFEPLFSLDVSEEPQLPEVCMVLFFSTTVSASQGLGKIVCIDREGAVKTLHNGFHDYIDELLALLPAAP